MAGEIIYLDNNATTRCAPEVLDAMLPFLGGEYGNAASPHLMGRRAAAAVVRARDQIAESVQCAGTDVWFTSGATEANNIILLGLSRTEGSRRKIITSKIEHKSVLEPLGWLADQGFTIVQLPVNCDGVVDLYAAQKAIDDKTLVVSIQAANNEVGTLQPVSEIARLAHNCGSLMHCDAAQLLGKLPISLDEIGADFLTFSTHKAYGPKGVGFLVFGRTGVRHKLSPIFFGGGQEGGLRPGTLNVPGIVGTGEACRICRERAGDDATRVSKLRDDMEHQLRGRVAKVTFAAASSARLPGTSTIIVPGIPADLLISRLPDVCISIGSACSSGTLTPSHVLLAMGFTREDAQSAVRLSIGRYNTSEEVEQAVVRISEAIGEINEKYPNSMRQHIGENRKELNS